MIHLLLALGALLAPPMPAQPDPVQFATVSPQRHVVIDAGGESTIPLEAGHVVGLEVLASDGLVTPNGQCSIALAAAAVGASGAASFRLEVGRRGGDAWVDIGRSPTTGPLPMVSVRILPGESVRLVVSNDGRRPIVVWPSDTRVSVVALDCVAPFDGGVAGEHQRGMFVWLSQLCSDQADDDCVTELVRHYHALNSSIGAEVAGAQLRPPAVRPAFIQAAPALFVRPRS